MNLVRALYTQEGAGVDTGFSSVRGTALEGHPQVTKTSNQEENNIIQER